MIGWMTASLGALVVGLAIAALIDELWVHMAQAHPDRRSSHAMQRSILVMVVSLVAMALWMWLWLGYVAS